jgi:hypothetical protein
MANQQYTNIYMLLETIYTPASSERRPSFFAGSRENRVVAPRIDDTLGRLIGRHICHMRLI